VSPDFNDLQQSNGTGTDSVYFDNREDMASYIREQKAQGNNYLGSGLID